MKPSAKRRSSSFRYLGRHAPSIRTPLLHATSAGTSHTPLKTTSTTNDHPVDPMSARLVGVHATSEARRGKFLNGPAERKSVNKRASSRPVATANVSKRGARSRSSPFNQRNTTETTESRMRIRKIPQTLFRLKRLPIKSPVTVAPCAKFASRRNSKGRPSVRPRVTAKAQPHASKDVLDAVQRGLVQRRRRKDSVAPSRTTWKERRHRIRKFSIEGLLVRRLKSFPEAERSRLDAWALMTSTSVQEDRARAGGSSEKNIRALADPASKALADDVVSPFQAILDYEKSKGIPPNWINHSIAASNPNGAWQKLERGDIALDDAFFREFKADLSNEKNWRRYYARYLAESRKDKVSDAAEEVAYNVPPLPDIDAEWLYWEMMRCSRKPDPYMYPALKRLRAIADKSNGKLIVAALSNTSIWPPGHPYHDEATEDGRQHLELRSMFDLFISSAHVGMRKPDDNIYLYTIRRLHEYVKTKYGGEGVRPEQVLFLDDIGANLRTARRLGFSTIKVTLGRANLAVTELEKRTGLVLTGDSKARL
ncbi:hypothetical protein LTR42_007301 [Elasticomyces elasticus]|nr:hypothetical protein LTR42_007301 [Elasticomyces elasticus]